MRWENWWLSRLLIVDWLSVRQRIFEIKLRPSIRRHLSSSLVTGDVLGMKFFPGRSSRVFVCLRAPVALCDRAGEPNRVHPRSDFSTVIRVPCFRAGRWIRTTRVVTFKRGTGCNSEMNDEAAAEAKPIPE